MLEVTELSHFLSSLRQLCSRSRGETPSRCSLVGSANSISAVKAPAVLPV